ncbi:MAG: hypothetical protein R3195_08895 [Gemmatimonadota bacterium]|nr:hypothetical protein [Gemmatimonadota bacterium]
MIARIARNIDAGLTVLLLSFGFTACGPDLQGREAADQETVAQTTTLAGTAIETRRVWSGQDFGSYAASPSPDGRFITTVNQGTGDLAVVDLESGTMRGVTRLTHPWLSYADNAVFSPDGSRIAYTWGAWDVEGGESGEYEIRTISLEGEDMRIVLPGNPSIAYPNVEDWSRDGTRILLTVFRTDRTSEIGVLELASGRYVKLETNDWRAPIVSAFSPDGRFIAYDFPSGESFGQRDILILATDGSRKGQLVSGPGHERLLGWFPDGSGILFHRQTDSSRAIWRLPVQDGRAAGEPELVKDGIWQMTPFGFSRDAYFYGVDAQSRQVHTVQVDPAAGRALSAPEPVTDASAGSSRFGAWSPDGTQLAYLLDSPGFRHSILVVESLTGERLRELPVPLSDARNLRWAERGFFILGVDAEGVSAVFLFDPVSGDLEPQVRNMPGQREFRTGDYEVSLDGTELVYALGDEPGIDRRRAIMLKDLITGEHRVLVDGIRDIGGHAQNISADGKMVSYLINDTMEWKDHRIMVAPTDGSAQPREVYRYTGRGITSSGAGVWTPDGQYLLFVEIFDDERGAGIYRLPSDGSGSPELLVNVDVSAFRLTLSPDGRRLAYEDGDPKQEIWRLTGLDGLTPTDR